jgi:hypothetical protein
MALTAAERELLERARAYRRDPFMRAQMIAYHRREITRAAAAGWSVPGTARTAESVPGTGEFRWPEIVR